METHGHLERKIEFVAFGHLAVDERGGRRVLGGAAAYSSIAASRLGLSTAIITAVGEEFDLFDPLDGIEVHFHREGSSTVFENLYEGEQRRQRLLGRARCLEAEDLSVLNTRLADNAIILYCPIADEIRAPLRRVSPGGLCGVAPQGFFRLWNGNGTVHAKPWADARERLQEADLLTMSEEDPPFLTDIMQQVDGSVPIVAVTEGEAGVRIYSDGDSCHVPAFPRAPVDRTGAGDVFAAALLIALRDGRPPCDAARFACGAASFAVEKDGVLGMPPSREAVEARINSEG